VIKTKRFVAQQRCNGVIHRLCESWHNTCLSNDIRLYVSDDIKKL